MRGCLRGARGAWCGRSLDLANRMFGDLVTTSLARDILEQFLADGIVTCEDNNPSDGNAMSLALTTAYDDAVAHACNAPPDKSTPEPETRYRWGWPKFPTTPIGENELVVFLNSIAGSALSTARSILKDDSLQPKNRFAPIDKNHVIRLSYGPDGEDMRPDFMVLPLTAFSDERELEVKDAYVNFTAMLLAGESKTASNARGGLIQVHRYMRGIQHARPSLRFAIGMSVGKDFIVLSRGDCSGLERIEISLTDGRGCIEFIRIILGIVLADKEAFGHNPEINIEERDVSLVVPKLSGAASAIPPTFSGRRSSRLRNLPAAASNFPSVNQPSATSGTGTTGDNTATGSKRGPDDEKSPGKWPKKQKRTIVFRAFVPVRVCGGKCTGILFTSVSIQGREITVYVVVGPDGGKTYSALKTSWQDVARAEGQAAVLKKLSQHQARADAANPSKCANVVISSKLFDPLAEDHRMLGSIRGFLADEIQRCPVENRILTVATSDLRRSVAYFWSPHDFVRGVLGALLGHEYLCEIGILHCDVRENNIVLSPRRGGLGALTGFDMAAVGRPNMHRDFTPLPEESEDEVAEELVESEYRPPAPLPASDEQYKAQRTAILFFLSYKGPLEAGRLREARVQGFIQRVGMGRLPHITTWPAMIGRWRSGTVKEMSLHKTAILSVRHRVDFMKDYL
ncbi:hypothetical protein EDD15DRAFT_2195994 [Pisolithus albus]|nr:hypothetical protein EDD15DRAFT_2195994 [Pisolithus albus]